MSWRPRRPLIRLVIFALIVATALIAGCVYVSASQFEVRCTVDIRPVSCDAYPARP